MAEIPIREYLHYIDQLIENSRLHEATAHCYHILEQHARHIDTYRMLGKSLLEQGEVDDAINIFQRVLSAEPEDFISHAGLAILYKEKGSLPQAIWHMERAFEADPYNAAIRHELMTLYATREEGPPERISLTRAALARLYAVGDLPQQAEAELRALLESDKSRVDLHALLAEVLWRHQQRVEAVELSRSLLERLPNCIKANAILAEVWLSGGRHEEAQSYLERLKELTLPDRSFREHDTPLGHALSANGGTNLPHQVLVNRLEYQRPEGEETIDDPFSLGETPDWLHELEETPPIEPEAGPEEAFSVAGPLTAPEDAPEQPGEDESAAWLDELAGDQVEPVGVPGWLDEMDGEPAEEAPAGPDWMADFEAEATEPATQAEVEEGDETDAAQAIDWLDEFASEIEEQAQPVPDDEAAIEAAEINFQDLDQATAWLDDLAARRTGETAEVAGEGEAALEEEAASPALADWFDQLPDEIPEDPDEAMAWLENLAAGQTAGVSQPAAMVEDEAEEPIQAPPSNPPAWQQLDLAHQALETGDLASAMAAYEPLLDQPEAVEMLITDLETVVTQHQRQPQLLRLLGEGYARHGELERALETYRQALDML